MIGRGVTKARMIKRQKLPYKKGQYLLLLTNSLTPVIDNTGGITAINNLSISAGKIVLTTPTAQGGFNLGSLNTLDLENDSYILAGQVTPNATEADAAVSLWAGPGTGAMLDLWLQLGIGGASGAPTAQTSNTYFSTTVSLPGFAGETFVISAWNKTTKRLNCFVNGVYYAAISAAGGFDPAYKSGQLNLALMCQGAGTSSPALRNLHIMKFAGSALPSLSVLSQLDSTYRANPSASLPWAS